MPLHGGLPVGVLSLAVPHCLTHGRSLENAGCPGPALLRVIRGTNQCRGIRADLEAEETEFYTLRVRRIMRAKA